MKRILAIDPDSRGFGFAVIEDVPLRLVDWGEAVCVPDRLRKCAIRVESAIELYRPDIVVVEEFKGIRAKRPPKMRAMFRTVLRIAKKADIKMRVIARNEILRTFHLSEGARKEEVAHAVAALFPRLQTVLPRFRTAWMKEEYRMSLFDAVALGLCALGSMASQNEFKGENAPQKEKS